MQWCRDLLDVVSRRKTWDVRSLHQTRLTRSLNAVELTGIGIASSAGLGIFAMTAHTAGKQAGPAVVLSVLVSGIAALLSGLCHMELATRLPRCGTGYTFCYVTLGELLAFVIGWSLVLENVLIGAAAAKALWQYVEYMHNSTDLHNVTATSQLPPEGDIVATPPDVFSCCVVIAVVFLTFITIKRCAIVHILLISLCGLVLLAFICVGFFHVEARNWNSPPGFFAHGMGGIVSGAALLMCTFTCFDNLASCAEETKTPGKSLPSAFGFTVAIVFTCLFLVTSALTLASPWQQLADNASLARAFETHGIFAANFVIGVGAVVGLLPVVIGSFLHPVRIVYAMSEDQLLPNIFSKVGSNGIPSFPHFLIGTFITFGALLLEFGALLEMSSIAIILEFTASSIITLLIRYQPNPVGISREYSDLDLSYASYEDVADCPDLFEFREGGKARLVLFTEEDGSECSGKVGFRGDDDGSSMQTQIPDQRQHVSEFQRCPQTGGYTSLFGGSAPSLSSGPALKFVNRFKKKSLEANNAPVYTEKDILKTSAHDTGGQPRHKSYGTDGETGLYAGGRSILGAEITEGNNNYNKMPLGATDQVVSVSSRVGGGRDQARGSAVSEGFTVRKVSSSCSLRRSGTQVTLQPSVSASSSLVNLGACGDLQADDASWLRARYFLLVYILASTCLAVTTQLWPGQAPSAHASGASGTNAGLDAIAVSINSQRGSHAIIGRERFRHVEHRKAFDSRIEEGGQYDVVASGDSDIGCTDHLTTGPHGHGGAWWAVVLLCVSLVAMLVSGLCIAKQPQNRTPLHFKTPYVPLVPLLALAGNMLLLAALPVISWSRFALWTLVGLVVYCGYSQRHSRHRQRDDQEVVLFDISQLPAQADSTT